MTQGGKKNKGMSPGLPNSWLNFRTLFKAVLRFVYQQQKKHLLLRLPFFSLCSPITNTLEGAPCSKIKTCLLISVKKQHVFTHSFSREAQGSGQTSVEMLLTCYHSFLQLFLATPIPLGPYALLTHCRATCGGVAEHFSAQRQPTTAFVLAEVPRRDCNTY